MSEQGTIVIGAVCKEFQPGNQPGAMDRSIGYSIADGRWVQLNTLTWLISRV